MSIKPVDFQIMLPKTSEVSKISSDQQHKNQFIQQQQATATERKSEHDMKYVHKQEDAQNIHLREKQEKNQGRQKDGKKKNKDKEESDSNTISIDIRL